MGSTSIVDLYIRNKDQIQSPCKKLWPLAILPIASWSIVIVLWGVRFFPDSDLHTFVLNKMLTNTHRIVGALLFSTAALIVALSARGRSWALPLIIIFALVDISFYSLRHKDRMGLQFIKDTIEMPPDTNAYCVSSYYQPNYGLDTPMLRGVNIHSGYFTFRPERKLDYEQTPAMRIAAMGWRKVRYDFTPESLALPDRGERWEKIDDPMPRLRLVTQSQVSEDLRNDILSIDVETIALTDTPIELENGAPGTVTLIEDKPGRVTLHTKTDSRQLLIFSESYHAGWKANIGDSIKVDIIPVYGDIMGCIIEPGEHTVTLHFDPESLATGKKLALAGLLLLLVYITIYGKRTHRQLPD